MSHLLAEYPDLVVLSLRSVREGADLFRRKVVRKPVEGASMGELLAALRRACGLLPWSRGTGR